MVPRPSVEFKILKAFQMEKLPLKVLADFPWSFQGWSAIKYEEHRLLQRNPRIPRRGWDSIPQECFSNSFCLCFVSTSVIKELVAKDRKK